MNKYIHNLCCLVVVVLLLRAAELIGLRIDFAMMVLGIAFYLIVRHLDKLQEKLPWLYQDSYIINYLTISIATLFLAILNALFGLIAKFGFDGIIVIVISLGIIIFCQIGLYLWLKMVIHLSKPSARLLYMAGYPVAEIIVMAVVASFLPF